MVKHTCAKTADSYHQLRICLLKKVKQQTYNIIICWHILEYLKYLTKAIECDTRSSKILLTAMLNLIKVLLPAMLNLAILEIGHFAKSPLTHIV